MAYTNAGQSRTTIMQYAANFRPQFLMDWARLYPSRIRGPLALRSAPTGIDFPQLGPSPYSLQGFPDYPIPPGFGGPWPDFGGGPPHSDSGYSGSGGPGGGGEGEGEQGSGESTGGGTSEYVVGRITAVYGAYGDAAGDVSYDAQSLDGTIVLSGVQPQFRGMHSTVAIKPAALNSECLIDSVSTELAAAQEFFLATLCSTPAEPLFGSGELPLDAILFNESNEPLFNEEGNVFVSSSVTRSEANAFDRLCISDSGEILFAEDDGNPFVSDTTDDLVSSDTFDFLSCNPSGSLVFAVDDEPAYAAITEGSTPDDSFITSVQSVVAASSSAGTPSATYIKADGTQALAANWDAGNFRITSAILKADTNGTAGAPPLIVGAAATPPGFYSDASGYLNVSVGGAIVSQWTDDPYFIPPDQGQTDAFAIGDGTTVNGIECVAIGNGSQAWNASSLGGSVAIGYAANAGNGAVARNKTVAIGAESAATHNSAIAIGYQATASGANTIAIGAGVTASALGPVVGYSCTATGTQALGAFGYTAVAGQTRSFALGFASAISANDFVIGDRGAANTTPRIVGVGCAGTAFQNCAMWYIQPSWKVSTNATRQSDAELGTFYSSSNTAIPAMRLFNDTSRGYVAMKAQTTAPADSDLNNGEFAFWIDGSGNFAIKYKDGSGTVTNGSVALA